MANRTTIHNKLGLTTNSLAASRSKSMLAFLRHASDRGRKELYLVVDDFEYHTILLLVATSNIIVKLRTRTHVELIVEKP